MDHDRNPQSEQMGDESMVRTLAHQADAIWPQEQRLFDRYGLSGPLTILDLGCGTGEITRRLALRYPQARLLGIDILESNLAIARKGDTFGGRIRYEKGDAFALGQGDASFKLVVCRHMSQAVPDFPQVLAEITRVLEPGGWLHLLSEDYGMLHMPALGGDAFDPDRFWNTSVVAFAHQIGCDARIGRHSPPLLDRFGYLDIAMDYVTVDTLRVPRVTFAGILKAWRDGYVKVLADASGHSVPEVTANFDAMISAIETPPQYAVWHVPIVSGRKPG
ncbi:class I SAM-dependent methyltransferase [Hyalangium versicolor]|uniref:class I SAM-dependent methyltransferase n=1 Tax=Hyalangium versicolor TaxID=2861190 RepID=UPI001CCE35D6|nr:class I SAM-dependent methyltransferase [Hyalangium versicolor]